MDRKPEPVNDSPDAKKGKKKWPKEVYLSPTQYFDDKAFYNWSFDDPASGYWGYIIVISIMAILLFPVWPDIGKIVVFYMSLYTLIFLVVSSDPARRDFDKTGDLPRGEGIRV